MQNTQVFPFESEELTFETLRTLWSCRHNNSASTYVVFVTFHVVGEGGAAELVGTEEAEVTRDLSGDGGGQALEEALRSLIPHYGFDHRPHCASDRAEGHMARSAGQCAHTHNNTNSKI